MVAGNFNSMGANPFKLFEQMKLPQFDYDTAISACCKNVDAMSEAQKKAMEMISTVSQMQTDFARSAIQEAGQFMKSFTSAKTLEEKTQLHRDAMKDGVEKFMSHSRGVAEKLTKSHKDMTAHVGKSWNEIMKHAKETMKASSKKG
jgi:phasin family protein